MIEYYIWAAIFVGWCSALLFSMHAAIDRASVGYSLVFAIILIIGLGFTIGRLDERNKEYPCVEYEIRNQYNPAAKTVMPMRVCVERGEWIEK